MLIQTVLLALITRTTALLNQTIIDGITFENYGMTGFGLLPANSLDKYGETISFGSSVAYQDLSVDDEGVYHFTAWGLPDRGYNVKGTVNTLARIHKFSVDYTPKNESTNYNIIWNYEDTILLKDMNGQSLTGLDSNTSYTWNGKKLPAVTYQGDGWGNNMYTGPNTTALCLDAEGLTLIGGDLANGFWISDEYGPSLMKFDAQGNLQDYIQAPDSILPHAKDNSIDFSSENPPDWLTGYVAPVVTTGRTDNKGYEGVDISPDGKFLYALLQSATMQDGGNKAKSRMNTRLVKYDITGSTPQQVGEYVVVLPTYQEMDSGVLKPKTAAQSEMRVISEDIIMVLPRDSDLGHGGEDGTQAIFKHVDFWSLKDATNIIGQYDSVGAAISTSNGVLNGNITPATYYPFISLIDDDQLSKFGIHNGGDADATLINEKWEGMTLIPVDCTTDEYFLLLVSDNDYKTTQGKEDFGKISYDAGIDVDNQSMMFHIKLPNLPHGNACSASSSSSDVSQSSSSNGSSSASQPSSILSPESSTATSLSSQTSVETSITNDNLARYNNNIQTPVYIYTGSETLTRTLTFTNDIIDVPVGGIFPRDITIEQTIVIIPTPTVTGWSGSFTTTAVVQMTEILNDGETRLVDVTLVETPISSILGTTSSSTANSTASSLTANSSYSASMTTITTVVNGVTKTLVVPCETVQPNATQSYTIVTTVINGTTSTLTVPCDTVGKTQSMTTITTVIAGITVTTVVPCDSITSVGLGATTIVTKNTASTSTSITQSSRPQISQYEGMAAFNTVGMSAAVIAIVAVLL